MKYILCVNAAKRSTFESISSLISSGEIQKEVKVIQLRHFKLPPLKKSNPTYTQGIQVETRLCDYFDSKELQGAVSDIKDSILAVICRSEHYIQYLAELSKILKKSVFLPSAESLAASSDKFHMRTKFTEFDNSITPLFEVLTSYDRERVDVISQNLGFPLITKPANLASSVLVEQCNNKAELHKTLKKSFNLIQKKYQEKNRTENPYMVVEQKLQGKLYSLDSYVDDKCRVYHTPLVRYLSGSDVGIDDFFLYKRYLPVDEGIDSAAAEAVAKKGIQALGLRNTTTHIELIDTSSGWKIIEIGPRMGRYRNIMYRLGYDFSHSENDLRIRLGIAPVIKNELKNRVAAYSIFAKEEGGLKEIHGVNELKKLKSLKYLKDFSYVGQECKFAKNGGERLLEVIISSSDTQQFILDMSYIEDKIYVELN